MKMQAARLASLQRVTESAVA